MALPANTRFSFGQTSPLTTQLANLIRDYPAGPGIIKEFLQNADDAGARELRITMDWRDYGEGLQENSLLKPLLGPALLLSNDRAFTDQDFDNIRELGKGGKRRDASKTGRFGLGFNTAYNITDYPSFISRSWMICFDPHQDAVAQSQSEPGIGYVLSELQAEVPAWLRSFEAGGLAAGAEVHEGTIFRLPLRGQAQANKSKISRLPFDKAAFEAMMELLITEAAAMLLFTRHVMHLSVVEVDTRNRRTELLSVETQNPEGVTESRARVLALESRSLEELRANRDEAGAFLGSAHRHDMQVRTPVGEARSMWHVVIGHFIDADGTLLKQAEKLQQLDGKAVPEVGVAIAVVDRREQGIVAEPVEGRLYCSLPLSAPSGLPVHVNGYFDLNGSRTALTADPSAFRERERLEWNRMLLCIAIPEAYASAIASLPEPVAEVSVESFYSLWPRHDFVTAPLLREAVTPIHKALAKREVFRCVTDAGIARRALSDLHILPANPEAESLRESLVADGLILPDPPLPSGVIDGAREADVPLTAITPRFLCERWRRKAREVWDLSSAPYPALRRRDWLKAVTRFILSDDNVDLRGLPIALLADGSLSSFPTDGKSRIFLGNEDEILIFRSYPRTFIDSAFCAATGLKPRKEAGFIAMTPEIVLNNLHAALPKISPGSSKAWSPDGEVVPNAKWLVNLLLYLTQHAAKIKKDELKSFPLIPDQGGRLHTPHHARSPLLRPERESGRELAASLVRLGIPMVTGPADLICAVEGFGRAFGPPFARSAASLDLVDTLDAYGDDWRNTEPASDPAIFKPLLDLLSRGECVAELDEGRCAKLKRLPILPTTDGRVLAASDDSLFLPAGEQPPPFASPLRIARTDGGVPWRPLLEKLGVQPLEVENLVTRVLLPTYAERSPEEQRDVLRFLRGAGERLLNEAKPARWTNLKDIIAGAPLVRGNDGALHAPNLLYEPDCEAVKLLGDVAVVPDMNHYADEPERWLSFFRNLGMERRARVRDLWARVERLAATSGAEDDRPAIDRVYSYIKRHWLDLREVVVFSRASATAAPLRRTFASALKETAFFPALQSDPKGAFPGFQRPEKRLFRFNELHPRAQGHLVASQKPLLPDEPPREMQSDLGMLPMPPIGVVKAHFSLLLKLWAEPSHGGLKVEAFEKSLQEIYRFFARDAAHKKGDVSLRREYEDVACIWHRKQKALVRPRDAFAESVSFFEPIKVHVTAEQEVAAGLDTLGRRSKPELEDYVDFLRALSAATEGRPCADGQINQALHALSFYGETDAPVPRDLPVVTSERYLTSLARVYKNDAPHWHDRLELDKIDVIHRSVHARIVHEAPSLSEAVDEVLDAEPQVSLNAKVDAVCQKIRQTLRSAEFIEGLRRLVGQEYGYDAKEFVPVLDQFDLRPAVSIRTSLYLRGRARRIGSGDVRFFVDMKESVIWIATPSLESIYFELAKAINRLSDPFNLSDLSSLEKILEVPRDRIASTLDSRGVPRLDGGSMFHWEDHGMNGAGVIDDDDAPPLDDVADEIHSHEAYEGSSLDDEPASNAEPHQDTTEGGRYAPEHLHQPPRDSEQSAGKQPAFRGEGQSPYGSGDGPREPRVGPPGFGSDDAPPIKPGHGTSSMMFPPSSTPVMARTQGGEPQGGERSPGQGAAQPRGRFATYVAPKNPGEPSSDEGGARVQHRKEVDEAAVGHVLRYELRAGRTPKPMRHENKGYDVESTDKEGNVRYIEVKGIGRAWDAAGVSMTDEQFAFALEKGESAWLYIIENALHEREAKVRPIRDPARKVSHFFFDRGWLASAEEEPASSRGGEVKPEKGLMVVLPGGEEAVIETVEPFGSLSRVTVRSRDGVTRTIVWRPDMRVVRPEE